MKSRTIRALLAPTLFLALPFSALAQQKQPELKALDAYIEQARAAWDVPGLSVAIVKDGKTVFAKGYGVREAGKPDRVDENTLFEIASNSKAFTSAGLAVLVDEHKLTWDTRIRDVLPWFQLYDRYVTEQINLRDALSHRSGVGTFAGDLLWWGAPYSAEEVVRRLRYLPQAGAFRASYNYNNLMFITAGEVLHAVSGEPWGTFIRKRILLPLGMNRTILTIDSIPARTNVAAPHKVVNGRNAPIPWHDWNAMAAAGGVISSAADMSQWLKLQLRGGILENGDTLFSPQQQWTMWTVHTPQAVSPGSAELYPSTHLRGYGLGWGLNDYKGRRIVSHGGAYDGMYSRVVLIPEEKLGIVVLTNSMTGVSTAIGNRIMDAYLGGDAKDWTALLLPREQAGDRREAERRANAVKVTVPNTKPSLALGAYQGTYASPLYGDVTVTSENGHLVLRMAKGTELVADLGHLQFDTFRMTWRRVFAWFEDGTAQFVLDAGGRVNELRIDVPNNDIFFDESVFVRKR